MYEAFAPKIYITGRDSRECWASDSDAVIVARSELISLHSSARFHGVSAPWRGGTGGGDSFVRFGRVAASLLLRCVFSARDRPYSSVRCCSHIDQCIIAKMYLFRFRWLSWLVFLARNSVWVCSELMEKNKWEREKTQSLEFDCCCSSAFEMFVY